MAEATLEVVAACGGGMAKLPPGMASSAGSNVARGVARGEAGSWHSAMSAKLRRQKLEITRQAQESKLLKLDFYFPREARDLFSEPEHPPTTSSTTTRDREKQFSAGLAVAQARP